MTEEEKNRLEKLEKQKRKQLDRQNKFINENYDRIGIALPKGQKAEIEKRAAEKGFKTITEYIKYLLDKDKKQYQEQKTENPEEKKADFLEDVDLPF